MSIRTNQNEPTATECNRCDRLRSCISFTKMIHDSTGWRAQGTFTLCRDCLRSLADELAGVRHVKVMATMLRDAGIALPPDARHDQLSALLDEHDLPYPGAGGEMEFDPAAVPDAAPAEPAAESAPVATEQSDDQSADATEDENAGTGLLTAVQIARQRADDAGVPYGKSMNAANVTRRIDIWGRAKAIGIDLPDDATTTEAEDIVLNSELARSQD